jgi:hypothetical protein
MSKDLGPNSPKKINVEQTAEMTETLSKGITALVPMTKTQKGLSKILADDHAKQVLTNTMSAFVHIDMRFESGMRSMGEILHNLLKMPEDLQKKAIAAICQQQGIEPIEETGRKGFAMALYAKYPEMLNRSGKNKDTKAGMRLSSYIMSYKASLNPKRLTGRNGGSGSTEAEAATKPRSASDLFQRLYTSATNKEQVTLVNLAGRAGIEYEDWIEDLEGSEDTDGE